ncbi:ArsR family transcriptional regulator [Cobetia sp. L2A1]|uniref:ArsR family transcriptional regulator n=1 Tax=Cobetia sp. L2A1 TaxID=2686360 RepID=UPI00131E2A44|nr:ArsR family transcriptional regulator [Cobetia sp. L2A1]
MTLSSAAQTSDSDARSQPDASLTPLKVFKCLADDTRLTLMQLLSQGGELCVCELIWVLEQRVLDIQSTGASLAGISQPKVSRHLAQLRECGLLSSERRGQWVYYRLPVDRPQWLESILSTACQAQQVEVSRWSTWLDGMPNRPERCC